MTKKYLNWNYRSYIFIAGFDTSGLGSGSPIGRVTGGIPYTLTQTSGIVNVVVPVTE